MSKSPRRYRLGAVLALMLALVLSACSSPSEVTADAAGSTAAGDAAGSASSQQALQVAYKGQMGTPPTATTTPPQGVNLWVVSCGQQVPSCATPVAAAQEAARTIGWTVNLCDGQLNPDGWGSCVRQATSAGADVIIPVGIDCPAIQQPFQEAKDAGVTVVGGGGADCDAVGGQKLWASERLQLAGLDAEQTYNLMGKLAADWVIGKTDGQAQVLALSFTDPLWGPWLSQGFADEIGTCGDCKIVATLDLANNDFVSGSATQKFSTALLQAPDANAVFVPVGGWMPSGFAQAITSSGRNDQLAVITGLGTDANYDLIRSNGGQDAIVGYPIEWGAWGSVDTAIRALNGEQIQVTGDGFQVLDAAHNLPAAGQPFDAGVDYQSAYRQAWGV